MDRGWVYRRRGCRDKKTGRLLGARCPGLRSPAHGSWYFSADRHLPRGYAATSLADIAAAAGVARPTVFAVFGSKAALLRQVPDQALAGDDEPVPVADRPWFRPVWDAPAQAAVLAAYARVCTVIGGPP